jgi:pimeloyl-ACP methyl ester carboxylesterase
VILLGGGGTTPTATGRNQLFVTFSRRLARLGYPAFRFDYHGVGDSTGSSEFRLNRPFVRDVEGAVARLREFGLSEFILVGMCFGARTALSVGPTLHGLRGLALLAPPVRDYALSERRTSGWRLGDYARAAVDPRRLLGPRDKLTARRYVRFLMAGARVALRRIRTGFGGKREISWISQRFSSPLLSLADAKVPMLLLYGTEDEEYQDFLEAERAGFDNVLAGCPTIMASALPGQVHGFTRVESQTRTMDTVLDWIQALTSTDRSV